VGGDRGVRAHVGRGGVWHRRVLTLVVAADKHGAAAGVARSIDVTTEQANVLARSSDVAAGLPCARAGSIERAADVHRAALHAAHQPDSAAVILDAPRLDHAGVV